MIVECNCSKRNCRWYQGLIYKKPEYTENDIQNSTDGFSNLCKAFPDGIPSKIAYG